MSLKNKFLTIRRLLDFDAPDIALVKKVDKSPASMSFLSLLIIFLGYPLVAYLIFLLPLSYSIRAPLNTLGIALWMLVHAGLNHKKLDRSWLYRVYNHFFPKKEINEEELYSSYIKKVIPILSSKENQKDIIEFLNVFCSIYIDTDGLRQDRSYNQLSVLKNYLEEGKWEKAIKLLYLLDQEKKAHYNNYDSMSVKPISEVSPALIKKEISSYPIEPFIKDKIEEMGRDIEVLLKSDWEPEVKFNLNNILKVSLPQTLQNIQEIPPKLRHQKSEYSNSTPQQMFNDSLKNIEIYVEQIKQFKINQNIKSLAINSRMNKLYANK